MKPARPAKQTPGSSTRTVTPGKPNPKGDGLTRENKIAVLGSVPAWMQGVAALGTLVIAVLVPSLKACGHARGDLNSQTSRLHSVTPSLPLPSTKPNQVHGNDESKVGFSGHPLASEASTRLANLEKETNSLMENCEKLREANRKQEPGISGSLQPDVEEALEQIRASLSKAKVAIQSNDLSTARNEETVVRTKIDWVNNNRGCYL